MSTNDVDEIHLPSCVTRREFMIRGSLTGIAILLAGCSADNGPMAPGSVSLTLTVSDYPELANVGGVTYVTASGSPLAVVRLDATNFEALSRVCPHQGGTVNSNSSGFTCPVHGARFSDTGTWVGGQSTSNLTTYPTQFDSSTGVLTIG
jgi:cytochrome b6-f complex iron-sulfur subunit